jgi:hypothetical protein
MASTASDQPAPSLPAATHDHDRGGRHWESWALRALLAAIVILHLLTGNLAGAVVAGEGLLAAMIPPLISRFSGWHVPRMLELTFVLAMVLQFVSESFKLFELLTYWDKIVHPVEIFLAAGVGTLLFLGYAELHRLDMPDGLAAAGAMLFGMTLGASWELVEFALDWFGNANLQKSNADTLTDILTNDVGAIFGTLFALWLYRHRTSPHQRSELGEIGEWLTARLAGLLARHGLRVGVLLALVLAAIVAAGWLTDRQPVPPPPGASGPFRHWSFASGTGPPGPTAALLGHWETGERGICRTNPDRPLPGSEQMGLVLLEPGTSYGGDGYVAATRFFVDRPPIGAGTAMEVGLAFGVRGPDDFYLLKASLLHDVFVLERYVRGRKRGLREERVRLRGDEWHELGLVVRGGRVAALGDGRPIFEETGLPDTDGGIGLWARVTAAGCFGEARVEPAEPTRTSSVR